MASGDRIARAFAERRFALGDEEQPVTMRFVSERPSENFERRARISAASPSSIHMAGVRALAPPSPPKAGPPDSQGVPTCPRAPLPHPPPRAGGRQPIQPP